MIAEPFGVAADLLAVVKAIPVADLAIQCDQREIAQAFGTFPALEALHEILLQRLELQLQGQD